MVRNDDKGGFPPQQQDPPGLTTEMEPVPDHGEETYEGHGRLADLRALITGGDSGIGRAVAIAYAREGADVAISYLEDEQSDAEDTASWVRRAGRNAVLVPGDLTDRETCDRVVADAVAGLGGLDVLVNNAGFHWDKGPGEGLEGLTDDNIERVMRTNLHAVLWLCRAALPHLQPGSSIINTTSIQAYDPSPALLDYAATKAALNNLTVNLAQSLGPKGIRVNAVAPGPIWTPLQPATRETEKIETFGSDTPLGRAGQPGEVAPAFVFLASPSDASFVSGTVLGVTGGQAVF
ncbi:MAG TPA: SDR family oxidoreductase [Intrasporangium sp.]|uniref:SDR family oxidoreductase n=1 Tax=Intrasporangium sp. TaxID=1925024 RepID=UPI002B49B0B8|nr:SDR family oxidoreductase [Intrasporangium sp.]HKX69560.1 SDR family oxidoreductase [Intrasporangium sp.]